MDVFGILSDLVKTIRGNEGEFTSADRASITSTSSWTSAHVSNALATWGHELHWSVAFSEYRAIPLLVPEVAEALTILSILVLPRVYIRVYEDSEFEGIKNTLQTIFYNLMVTSGKTFPDLLRHLLMDGNLFFVRDTSIAWRWIDPANITIALVVKTDREKQILEHQYQVSKNPLESPPVKYRMVYILKPFNDYILGPSLDTYFGGVGLGMKISSGDLGVTSHNPKSLRVVTEQQLSQIAKYFPVYTSENVIHLKWEDSIAFFPYGKSLLEDIRFVWKQFMVAVQGMLIFRLAHAFKRDIVLFPTGDINPLEAKQRVSKMIEDLFGDWLSWGSTFLRTGKLVGPMTPIVIPYPGDYKPEIQKGEAPPQRYREIDDVLFFIKQILAGMRVRDIIADDRTLKFMAVEDIIKNRPPQLLAMAVRLANLAHLLFSQLISKTTKHSLLGGGIVEKVETIFEAETYPSFLEILPAEELKEGKEGKGRGLEGGPGNRINLLPIEQGGGGGEEEEVISLEELGGESKEGGEEEAGLPE